MNVLYLGDDRLEGAASYLAGVMTHSGIGFDHIDSGEDAGAAIDRGGYDLYVLSDYASATLGAGNAARIVDSVGRGVGLVMIGGWESFHGAGGNYRESPIAEVLPVVISGSDDRVNSWGPCVVRPTESHPVLSGLDFDPAPVVGGFNRLEAKPDATVVLEVDRYAVEHNSGNPTQFTLIDSAPLLTVGRYAKGSVAAFASDVAPHWVGGFVDWGATRVMVETDRFTIEVGEMYVRFFANMLRFLAFAHNKTV